MSRSLAAMTGKTVGDCLMLLDEAATAALVVEAGTASERRFAHDLIRDAIISGLDAGQRVRLHRAAAEAIESNIPHAAGVTFDVAHHWVEAAVDGDRAMAVTWTERAGREAMRLHAYEEGRRWYGRALTLGAGVLGEVARCRLMIAYAGAAVPVLGLLRRVGHVPAGGGAGGADRPARSGGRRRAGSGADVRRADRRVDPGFVRTRPGRLRLIAGRGSGAGAGSLRVGVRPPVRPARGARGRGGVARAGRGQR